jgi:hypothetical protein
MFSMLPVLRYRYIRYLKTTANQALKIGVEEIDIKLILVRKRQRQHFPLICDILAVKWSAGIVHFLQVVYRRNALNRI